MRNLLQIFRNRTQKISGKRLQTPFRKCRLSRVAALTNIKKCTEESYRVARISFAATNNIEEFKGALDIALSSV